MEEVGDGVRMWNLYGTSETTMAKFYYEVKKEDAPKKIIPIGKPMPGAAAIVVTDKGKPCPQGMIGEIYIRTAYRSLGYYNQEEQTKEVFIRNPFSQDEQDIVYKTGDLGRVLKDGNYECLGRRDNQVKIRGVRVELGEVEEAIRRCAGVRDVAVIDQQRGAEKYLCAYVVMEAGARAKQVREEVAAELSEVMRPSRYVEMEELPRTISGKVDRRGLPEGGEGGVSEEYVEARSGIEEVIAGIWKEVLGVGRVGVHDNFFELGGHSLRATQVLGRIRGVMGVEISLKELFRKPTVEGLAEEVERRLEGGEKREERKIEKVSREGEMPLSFAQHRFWFLDQLVPGNPYFNMPMAVRVSGPLDVEAMRESFNRIIERHETLRSIFLTNSGEPFVMVVPHLRLKILLADLTELSEAQRESEVLRLAGEAVRQPFDLSAGPLLRVRLAKLDNEEHVMILAIHHIVSDGWSMSILVREAVALYDSITNRRPPRLPELPIQYIDYAAWQRQRLTGEFFEEKLSYWREQLAGAPESLELSTDFPRRTHGLSRRGTEPLALDRGLSQQMALLGSQEGVTQFMFLLAAYQVLLSYYSGQDDIIVGSPIASRDRPELENLIGLFINTLVLRTKMDAGTKFNELLSRVRETTLGAYLRQDIPFDRIVSELQPDRASSRSPLFQVWFVLQNTPMPNIENSGLTFSPVRIDHAIAQFDLSFNLGETLAGIRGSIEYNADLFAAGTIQQMTRSFETLLQEIVARPDITVGFLKEKLAEREKHDLMLKQDEFKQASRTKLQELKFKHAEGLAAKEQVRYEQHGS
jgi:acyl carrier protein